MKKTFKDTDEEKQEREERVITQEISPSKRTGKFVGVAGSEVIVDVNGNGERIAFIPSIHGKLKIGDVVEL